MRISGSNALRVAAATWLLAVPSSGAEDGSHYWIFFRDKGSVSIESAGPLNRIPPKALARRRIVRSAAVLFDRSDEPLASDYVAAVARTGAVIRVRSRWLNAVSVSADPVQLGRIRSLPFVLRDQPVAFGVHEPLIGTPSSLSLLSKRSSAAALDYGAAFEQAEIVRVPAVHEMGLTGKGVVIGMLDDGFEYRGHPAFKNLTVVAEHDFYDGNGNTSPENGDDPKQGAHGTGTLSVIGGYDPGELVGPAYGASFALAKTEWIPFEKRLEEDKWVAGLEWLVDTVGVDIVSSSLGYDRFPDDESDPGYTYADMNGRTCVTTLAAERAVSRGVVVVNSAGNEFDRPWHFISSPADGDSVIAVGAVNLLEEHAYFSSCGPTSDGRIKPDVSALGLSAYHATAGGGYAFSNGTSYSCPMVAGICALMLEAHPGMSPAEVIDALKETASRADHPDTLLGWGIADAYEAVFRSGPVFRNFSALTDASDGSVSIRFRVFTRSGSAPESAEASVWLPGDLLPRRIPATLISSEWGSLYTVDLPATEAPERIRFYLAVTDDASVTSLSPRRAPDSLYTLSEWMQSSESGEGADFSLSRAYPNPFTGRTFIECNVRRSCRIELEVIDCVGRRVYRFPSVGSTQGRTLLEWNGRDAGGRPVPTGLYLVTARSGRTVRTLKLLYFQEGRTVFY
jgi:serine protease AprX